MLCWISEQGERDLSSDTPLDAYAIRLCGLIIPAGCAAYFRKQFIITMGMTMPPIFLQSVNLSY